MKARKITAGLITMLSAVALTACTGAGAKIEGSWTEPVPGMPEKVQGFKLKNGGEAVSINMETLRYEKWEKKGDMLILTGKSIGNSQTIPFTDTMIIESLTKDKLVLKSGNETMNFKKQQ